MQILFYIQTPSHVVRSPLPYLFPWTGLWLNPGLPALVHALDLLTQYLVRSTLLQLSLGGALRVILDV